MDSNPAPQTPSTEPQDDANALETPEGSAAGQPAPQPVQDAGAPGNPPPPAQGAPKGIKRRLRRFNVYLLIFLLILVIAGVIIGIAYLQSKNASKSTIQSQSLTQNTLSQLANSDATVGDPKQVLNVESNAVFAGKVLVRDSLEVAGGIQVGGTVALEGLTVSGDTNLQQVEVAKNLSVTGNAGIQGQATIGQSLQVNGTGTFNGALSAPQLTTGKLQLNGDLTLTHHIIAGGPAPSESTNPDALGSGGTASFNGSDTSGSITVNTGSSPAAGCFITINFASKYASTPRILATPIGSTSAGIPYYVSRSPAGFSLCDAAAAPAGSSFTFDYFVVD
jgi:cytoskeletal protein CcmA (bactofilin family)